MSKTTVTLEHLEHQECPVCLRSIKSVEAWPEVVHFACGCVIAWDGDEFGGGEWLSAPCPKAHEMYLRLRAQRAKGANGA